MFRFIAEVVMPVAKKASKKGPATKAKDFGAVSTALRQILDDHGKQLAVHTDKAGNYHTTVPRSCIAASRSILPACGREKTT